MKIYEIIIIEDDALDVILLKKILKDVCEHLNISVVSPTMTTVKETLLKHKPDIVLMSVELSSGTAFDILSDLHEKDAIDFEIIFLTAYERYDYIIKAIDYSALAFLIKPIDPKLLREAIEKAKIKCSQKTHIEQALIQIQERDKPNTKIIVPTANYNREAVSIADIAYFEADRSSTVIHFLNGSALKTCCLLGHFKKVLMDDFAFFLIHHSILVNVEQIKLFRTRDLEITLNNDTKLYPSRRFGKDFKNYWSGFKQNKNDVSVNFKNMF